LFVGTRLSFSFTFHSFHIILYVAAAKVFNLKLFFEKISKKNADVEHKERNYLYDKQLRDQGGGMTTFNVP